MKEEKIERIDSEKYSISGFFKYLLRDKSSSDHKIIIFINRQRSQTPESAHQYILLKRYLRNLELTQSNHFTIIAIKNRKRKEGDLRHLKKGFQSKVKFCFYCQCVLNNNPGSNNRITVDHFIPLQKGGTNKKNNLRASCYSCNRKKGDIHPLLEKNKYMAFMSWAESRSR